MTLAEAIAVAAAGFAAGGVNTIVGSGSLITFPTLLAVGYPSVTANVSNTVGLVPGGISSVIGYRREMRGQWRRALILGCGTTVGALIGGILLLTLPESVFEAVVPVLILLAAVLMAIKRTPSEHADTDAHHGGDGRVVHDRHLRRLLRRGPGDHPDVAAALLPAGRPAAAERAQERARGRGERGRGDPVHRRRRRRLGGGRV